MRSPFIWKVIFGSSTCHLNFDDVRPFFLLSALLLWRFKKIPLTVALSRSLVYLGPASSRYERVEINIQACAERRREKQNCICEHVYNIGD